MWAWADDVVAFTHRRFVLRCGAAEGSGAAAIALAVWGSEVAVLLQGQAPGAKEKEGEGEEGTPALKVTYRVHEAHDGQEQQEHGGTGTTDGCCGHDEHGHGATAAVGVAAVPSAGEALELTLPLEEWHAVRALLVCLVGWRFIIGDDHSCIY